MRYSKGLRYGRICLLVSVVALTLAACAAQPPLPAPYFSATDISMDSATDGWAVGEWVTPDATPDATRGTPALAHYQNGQWRLAPASVTGDLGLYGLSNSLVRMITPTDGWATMFTGIYHYDGMRWRLAPTVGASIGISDLEMSSPEGGWAVGEFGILQFAHGVWTNVTASLPPPPADWLTGWDYPGLRTVAVDSATDAWAMGDGGVIWRDDGTGWRIVASPYFPNTYYTSPNVDGYVASASELAHATLTDHNDEALYASQMFSPTQGWSVGGATLQSLFTETWGPAVVEQYQARAWRVVRIATSVRRAQQPYREPVFYTLAMTSAQEGWVGGAWAHNVPPVRYGDQDPGPGPIAYAPLLLHYQAGQWTEVEAPAVGAIHRLVMVSASEGWAAADGGLLHYMGGPWRLVTINSASA